MERKVTSKRKAKMTRKTISKVVGAAALSLAMISVRATVQGLWDSRVVNHSQVAR